MQKKADAERISVERKAQKNTRIKKVQQIQRKNLKTSKTPTAMIKELATVFYQDRKTAQIKSEKRKKSSNC